jgi:hypothetical protein
MTLHTLTGAEDPGDLPGARLPLSHAIQAIGTLLSESPLALEQFHEARHSQAEADSLQHEETQAGQRTADAASRAAAERRKADPRERINRRLGTGIGTGLAVLDALPAYWSAQAFGLDQDSTLILTVLLCAALGAAMWLLDLFSHAQRRSALRVLEVTLLAGYVSLFVLRLDYLQVVGGEDFLSAAIESIALTAVSAALVGVGYVVLSHRMPKAVADAERAARETAGSGTAAAAAAARTRAARARAALQDTVMAWAVRQRPEGIGHEQFLQAVGQAIDIMLSR